MPASNISVNHLNYTLNQDRTLFKDLSLSLATEKIGLVGKNGVGKSTLLKLLTGELLPTAGTVETYSHIAYCPQELNNIESQVIADALGVADKLHALASITAGSTDEQDYQILNDDWNIAIRVQQQLTSLGLSHLALDRSLESLSGGEKTRVNLAKLFLNASDFIILDEPTNNLDQASREFLYTAIKSWAGGMLIVSHDRTLLNLMDKIIELTSLGVNIYGGNYTHYAEQKNLQRTAAERQLADAKDSVEQTKKSTQTTREVHEQKQSKGRKLYLSGSIDKMYARSQAGRSEKTQKRNATQRNAALENVSEQLQTAKAKIEISYVIDVELPHTAVPNGKVVLELEKLTFSYSVNQVPLINNFNLKLVGPQRIALSGDNGSGKTTLIKLILGELIPTSGVVQLGIENVSYLDQAVTALDRETSVLENFMRLNPELNQTEAHAALAKFLFRNTAAENQVKNLSGGEKLRALLACVLLAQHPPQLLILDEPTNNLDLESIASLESALQRYEGAMIVISHDQLFLENIGIEKIVAAPFKQ